MLLPDGMVEADNKGYKDITGRHSDVVMSKAASRAKSRAMWRHNSCQQRYKNFWFLE
jgi:hypothetical protein